MKNGNHSLHWKLTQAGQNISGEVW